MQLMPLYDVLGEADAGALLGSEPQSSQSAKGIFSSILDRQSELARKGGEAATAASSAMARSAHGGRTDVRDAGDAGKHADKNSKRLEEAVTRLAGGNADDETPGRDLKVGVDEFKSIKEALQEFGLSDEDIESLEEQVASEGGLTWGRLVTIVSAKAAKVSKSDAAPELESGDEAKLLSLFQKMGFSLQDAQGVLEDFEGGNTDLALARLRDKLEGMSDDQTLELYAGDLDALAKAMGLDGEASANLKKLLGGADKVRITKAELESVLAAARQSATDDANERMQRLVDLRDVIKDVFDKAKAEADEGRHSARVADDSARRNLIMSEHNKRQEQAEKDAAKPGENAALADEAEEGRSEGAKALRNEPRKSAAAEAKAAADKAADKAADAAADKTAAAADSKGDKAAKAARQGAADASAAASKADARAVADGRTAADASAAVKTDGGAGHKAGQDAAQADADDGAADPDKKAWDKFWSKVRREDTDSSRTARPEVGTDAAAAEKAAMAAGRETAVPFPTDASTTAEAAADKVMQRVAEGNPERILRQVEQGVLKNVGQGTKQLTLRLTPPDLGRVHLQIQAKEGEVRVLLKAENADAGRMISDNLHHIRQSLENQGLKVDKLEVQTQLADGQFKEGTWQGAQEHNEMLQRHRDMARMSRLRSLRAGAMGVAREMQNAVEQARISSRGLDIIA